MLLHVCKKFTKVSGVGIAQLAHIASNIKFDSNDIREF